jgi:hypothetical protein
MGKSCLKLRSKLRSIYQRLQHQSHPPGTTTTNLIPIPRRVNVTRKTSSLYHHHPIEHSKAPKEDSSAITENRDNPRLSKRICNPAQLYSSINQRFMCISGEAVIRALHRAITERISSELIFRKIVVSKP